MAPRDKSDCPALLEFLKSKKNEFSFQSSSIYHEFYFCWDRFREVFKLPDCSARDLDVGMLVESERVGGVMRRSDPIRKMFIALGKPFIKGAFNEKNYNKGLYDILKRKLAGRPHPMGDPENPIEEIHRLPAEVKLYLMNFLLQLRIQKNESEDVDLYCTPEALRVVELGEDSYGNQYFYFGDFRVVVELKEKQEYQHQPPNEENTSPYLEYYQEYTDEAQFLCIAETRDQWRRLVDLMSEGGKLEKAISWKIRNLYDGEQELHQAQLNRRSKLKADEAQHQKRLEIEVQKALGVLRTSGRIQAKEQQRKEKEEQDMQYRLENGLPEKDEEEDFDCDEEGSPSKKAKAAVTPPKHLTREGRRLQREAVVAEQMLLGSSSKSGTSTPARESFKRSNRSATREGSSDSGASSSLTSASQPRNNKRKESNESNPAAKRAKRETSVLSFGSKGEPSVDLPYYLRDLEHFAEFSIAEYYNMILAKMNIDNIDPDYQAQLLVAERFCSEELDQFLENKFTDDWNRRMPWPTLDEAIKVMSSGAEFRRVNSRLNLILLMDEIVSESMDSSTRRLMQQLLRYLRFCWGHLFGETVEDELARALIDSMVDNLDHKRDNDPSH